MGDKADNIPGCPGVGEKTAIRLINEFGGVEGLIAGVSGLKGALKKKVEENVEQILFSKYLATIRLDVPLDESPDSLVCRRPDTERLFAIFRSMEFRTLEERVRKRLGMEARTTSSPAPQKEVAGNSSEKKSAATEPASLFDFDSPMDDPADSTAGEQEPAPGSLGCLPHDFRIIDSEDELSAFRESAASAGQCGVAMLTEGDNDMALLWKATAVAFASGQAWMIPASNAKAQEVLLDLLRRDDLEKATASAKTDWVCSYLARHDADEYPAPGESPLKNFFDITLAHYILQPDMRHDLDLIARNYLEYEMLPPAPAPKKGVAPESVGQQAERLCERALTLLRLRPVMEEHVRCNDGWELLTTIEFPLVRVLARMEIAGVNVDLDALGEAARDMEIRLREVEKEVYGLTGCEFNIGSPSQVGEVLFDRMQLDPKAKKTKTGQYSTSEAVLEKIAHKSPVVGKILDYRKLKKLLSTYLTALPENINPATGRIHTNYNQTVAATGRLSSSNPNLQNIPVREDMGREIRRAFIPSPGNLFLSADYSQIELRLVADFAGDETMIDAFANGSDIHAITAARIYQKDVADVCADERRHAKTANFGILYGITAFGLASRLGIPRAQAKELIDSYFATFPAIRDYMSDSIEQARERGYALTSSGRRRYLPDIHSANPTVRGFAERNAVNAPVQGSAADIIKKAMIAIDAEMEKRGMKSKMIMQVHDELNFDVVEQELPELQELVTRLMQEAYSGRVPLTAESGVASNWLDAH